MALRDRINRVTGHAFALVGLACMAACTGGTGGAGTVLPNTLIGYSVGGTVSGLSGQGLMLQNNGGDTLAVAANGGFTFHSLLLPGNSYNVVVTSQPSTPTQTCAVTQGIGTVSSGNVSNIAVVCVAKTGALDTVGGTVSGNLGSGLVLQINGSENISVVNGAFTFPSSLPSGIPYTVTVLSPPINPYQNCSVANASGTTGASNVNDIAVTCTTTNNPTHTISGTITGLTSAHASAVLQNNGRDNLSMSADGPFTFTLPIPSGSFYSVTSSSLSGPVSVTCAFTNAYGFVGTTNVTNVSIACVPESSTPLTPVTVTVTGLSGKGLVLQDNSADNLPIAANGSYGFAVALPSGAGYDVTVLTQPTDPSQTCTVTNGSGTVSAGVPITVSVACTGDAFTIGGTVQGLAGTGLVLDYNEGPTDTITANGTFVFSTPLASGQTYQVTVLTQPTNPSQTCTVTNATGTIENADITNVLVSCTTNTYSIGGTVTGYSTGTGLSLQDNGGASLALSANGNFTFPAQLPSGAAYDVTIATQPTGPPTAPVPTCTVSNASGTVAAANVTNVTVTCTVPGATNEWTWESGSDTTGAAGVYGTLGTAAPGNVPGARGGLVTWRDAANNLWLFGGNAEVGFVNDLWEYSEATGLWTWQNGSSGISSPGDYGTLGVAAGTNVPGARYGAVSWTDSAGNFWLFGGSGYATATDFGYLNDLWRYSPTTGLWTWMSGSSLTDATGVYGTQGVAAAANVPGARIQAISWADNAGNLWLFGGQIVQGDSSPDANDLWRYNIATGLWTWVSGSNQPDGLAVYGTLGTPAAGNVPGARFGACSWIDPSGNLWLFGGNGYGTAATTSGYLNDFWRFSPATGLWTWISGTAGPSFPAAAGVYGTLGTPAAGNTPGGREVPVTYVDTTGNLWLFGGTSAYATDYNDLWEFNPTSSLWAWMGGSDESNSGGSYGTLGMAAPTNVPGARDSAGAWVDGAGNFWLFGGNAFVGTDDLYPNPINDLWKYVPP
jgi:hypothetical protein